MNKKQLILALFLQLNTIAMFASHQPRGFVYLSDIDPSIIQELRYDTYDNYVGRPVVGYNNAQCILTREAASALSRLQKQLSHYSLGLKVYDCYRPRTAMTDVMGWIINPYNQGMQDLYYPKLTKTELTPTGYINYKSSHLRGSAVDVTLVHLRGRYQHAHIPIAEVEMGTRYDFFDENSSDSNQDIDKSAYQNRLFLRKSMESVGFEANDKMWWHFTLQRERYPNKYFDFAAR